MKEHTNVFSQSVSSDDRLYRIFFWMLCIGMLLVFFWGIWSIPLLSHDEGRRLVVLREMMANHSWFIPTMNGEVYLEKPPLFYWSGAIFGLLANSSSEWVLRLPSGLFALCIVCLLFFMLKKYIGRWAALLGVLTLVTSNYFSRYARLAEIEMLLTLCAFAAVLFYFEYVKRGSRYYLYGSYAMLGLAFLTKWPVALLFWLPPIVCYGLLERSKPALRGLIDWRGWLIFSVIALPWFLYVNEQLPGAPLFRVIGNEMSSKIAGAKSDPFYSYLGVVVKGFAPWILVLLWRPRAQFKRLLATDAGRFFGLAALVPLIIFSLFAFKRDKYILPMCPALAVFLGLALASWLEQAKLRWRRIPFALTAFSAALIVVFVVYYTAVQASVMSYRYDAFQPLAARLDNLRGDAPVYLFKSESSQLVYYYRHTIPVVQEKEVARMLADGKSFLLLAVDARVNDARRPGICILEQIKPYGETNKVLSILGAGSLCRPHASPPMAGVKGGSALT
ncbi:MAG: glycosyltransferase family 39 protein [Deltaproteobacteria bacterium]|nr:glycosyltransferase family 39 protein [Deltaproteobacteria bacterium]